MSELDIAQAVKHKFINGLTDIEIAKMQGVSRQAVAKRLKPFKDLIRDKQDLDLYQANYRNILRNSAMILNQAINDPKKIESASLNNVAYAFNTVANHLRLEEGQSTENVSINSMVAHIKKSAEDITGLRNMLEDDLKTVDK